jgi:hypothetical protein
MPTIPLDGVGVTKSSLVEGAYEYCGLNGYEFERTPEEMVTGLRHLNALMAELLGDGLDLVYDFPTYGNGLLEEAANIPNSAVAAIHQLLAQRLIVALGGTLSPDAKAAMAKSYQGLRSRMAAAPPRITPGMRLPSSGVRHTRVITRDIDTLQDPGDLAGIVGG